MTLHIGQRLRTKSETVYRIFMLLITWKQYNHDCFVHNRKQSFQADLISRPCFSRKASQNGQLEVERAHDCKPQSDEK